LPVLFASVFCLVNLLNIAVWRFPLLALSGVVEWIAEGAFYGGLSASFLFVYTAVTDRNPTVAIYRLLEKKGADGADAAELEAEAANEVELDSKVEELLDAGWLAENENGSLSPSSRGRRAVAVLTAWRRALGYTGVELG
jgi:hypothetical protein